MTLSSKFTDRRSFLKGTGTAILVSSLTGCVGGGGNGDDGADFPTEDIRFVIPFSSGGGFDTYARALSEFMPEHLPNDVDVRPENVPGAGGRTGANEVYRADDAHTIGIFNIPGNITTQLVEDTEYDLTEITWIGRVADESYVLLVNPDTGYETLEDLQAADEVSQSATDFSATSAVAAIISTDVMGINTDFVTGYDGSSEALTAVIRGDVDGRTTTWENARSLVGDGTLHPIISLTEEPPSWGEDIPTVVDEGYEEAAIGLQRPIGAPPGIDDDQRKILADALEEAVKSDEMKEWSEESDRPLNYLSAEETDKLIQENIETFEKYSDLLEQYQ